MQRISLKLLTFTLLVFATASHGTSVHRVTVDGVINPVSARFMMDAVDRAEEEEAELLIIQLDTPGGLLEATRDIVQRFLAADVPVVVHVTPSGARAGSAGVFITMAAHIAVMSPGTNIGAAHPVTVGGGGMPGGEKDTTGSGVMSEKMTNDAVAMIQAIAEERKRNIEWAEQSVRESASITASVALEMGVIDLIAESSEALLDSIDGRVVTLKKREATISTENSTVIDFELTWQEELLSYITDPNVAYILMMIGIYGLIFELSNPGSILPGVVGVISLLLAFFAFQTLPLNVAGILLILFGIILLLLEIKVTSYGGLTIGGATSLLLGFIMLIETDVPELKISLGVIVPAVIATVAFVLFAVSLGIKAQTRKVTTGAEGLLGEVGKALETIDPEGQVLVSGEYWVAISKTKINQGDAVKVVEMKGMKLVVMPDHSEL